LGQQNAVSAKKCAQKEPFVHTDSNRIRAAGIFS
jgi:hypothetical protein